MAITIASNAATAPDFSTVMSGFTGEQRYLVNNAEGLFQLAQIDDATSQLIGLRLTPGVKTIIVERRYSDSGVPRTERIPFDITVTAAAAVPVPSISPTGVALNMPAGVRYVLVDAVSQLPEGLPFGMSFNTATGVLSGSPLPGDGLYDVAIVAYSGIREIARSQPFSVYTPSGISALTSAIDGSVLYSAVDGSILTGALA